MLNTRNYGAILINKDENSIRYAKENDREREGERERNVEGDI